MTDRTNDIATLITQLRVMGQLTRAEAQVARLRVTQASSAAVRDELRQNAADADGRATRIAEALRALGALPDPVTPLFGRVAALVKGALEQAQPLDEAVLGDLALEHQLRDRARYVAALADGTGRPEVRELAEHLEAAHTETVHWLTNVLADLGTGRQAALGASPLQQVAATVTHAANAPARPALDTVGAGVAQAVQTVTKVAGAARDTAAGALDTAGDAATGLAQGAATAAGAVRDTVTDATGKAVTGAATAAGAVRDTAAQTIDTVTDATGKAVAGAASAAGAVRDTAAEALTRGTDTAEKTATATADTVQATTDAAAEATDATTEALQTTTEAAAETTDATTEALQTTTEAAAEATDAVADAGAGGTEAPEDTARPTAPPLPDFAELPAHAAIAALRTLDDPGDVEAMLEFEQAHGDRPAVVAAARVRADALRTG